MSIKTALAAALAAAALTAVPASANVQVGSSGWQWGNPLPQGNTVRAMSFAGATGYAAGDFGTLLKTTDGGNQWSGLPVGTFQGLSVVQALDANTVFAGGGCVAAIPRPRHGSQPLRGDRAPGDFAEAIHAVADPLQGAIDLEQLIVLRAEFRPQQVTVSLVLGRIGRIVAVVVRREVRLAGVLGVRALNAIPQMEERAVVPRPLGRHFLVAAGLRGSVVDFVTRARGSG